MSDSEVVTTIIVQEGDTLETLATYHYEDVNQWETILQANPTLQGKAKNEVLPVGARLLLPGRGISNERRITTGIDDTLRGLADAYYHDQNRWPIIRNANPPLAPYGPDDILPTGIPLRIP